MRRKRLRLRDRLRIWRIAAKAVRENRGDAESAKAQAKRDVEVTFGIEITIILLAIRLVISIVMWLIENDYLDPPNYPVVGAPGFRTRQDFDDLDDGEEAEELGIDRRKEDLDFDSKRDALWGVPKRPVSGAWKHNGYAPRGKFGPREAASVGENFLTAQAIMVPASMAIETLAESALPSATRGAFFTASYAIQAISYLIMKVIASILRNQGENMIRNLFAWLYEQLMDYVGGLWPFSKEKRKERRQDRRKQRRRRILDWLFPFRRKRRRPVRTR